MMKSKMNFHTIQQQKNVYFVTVDRVVDELINFIPSLYIAMLFSNCSNATFSSSVNSRGGDGTGDAALSSSCST